MAKYSNGLPPLYSRQYSAFLLSFVSSIEDADQIIVLDGGQIVGVGTSEELLKTNEIYREVYESQVKGGEEDE